MNRLNASIAALLAATLAGTVAAHPATERHIPIGYWQTVADRETYIGEIVSHKADTHALTVASAQGDKAYKNVQLTEQTRIYLDRSQLKLPNLEGTYADCREGRTIEVRFAGDSNEAMWVKILITQP